MQPHLKTSSASAREYLPEMWNHNGIVGSSGETGTLEQYFEENLGVEGEGR